MSDSTEDSVFRTALRRDEFLVFEYLEVPPSPTVPTDLFQLQLEDEDHVPMQLLDNDGQELADLLLLYPKAKVRGTCITPRHFIFIVKLFLYKLKMSANGVEGVSHPEAFARLLCRLHRELESAPSFETVPLSDEFSDPTEYDWCLGELLKDMEDYIKTADPALLADGYVYVRRKTETYEQSLLAAAAALNSNVFS